MGRWMASARAAVRNQQRYPEKYLVIRYETLAHHPVETLHTVCGFIDEPYTESMLYMQGAPEHGAEGGNSSFEQFEPGEISTRSIGRYRSVLPKQDIAYIQFLSQQGMQRFDYPFDTVEFSASERFAYLLTYLPMNLARLAGWSIFDKVHNARGKTIPEHRLAETHQMPWTSGEHAANASSST
jgi:hypothetical protein